MHYEQFLFTRNQRQDFTAFVRPTSLTNKQVSAIGGIFNYVTDISRLTAQFPSLYCFPLGDYLLLLRHYNSGRQHAGRAIGVIEGIAVSQSDATAFASALSTFVADQTTLLNVSASIDDIESQPNQPSHDLEWRGSTPRKPTEAFVAEFLDRRDQDRLLLPFSKKGRSLLLNILADRRFTLAPFFAFGTNGDVLAQLEQHAKIDVAAFFTTDRPAFHSRATNRQTGVIAGYEPEAPTPDPSMSLRNQQIDEMSLRARPQSPVTSGDEVDEADSLSGMSLRQMRPPQHLRAVEPAAEPEDDQPEARVLTMRQMRDRIRAEEAALENQPDEAEASRPRDPIHWLIDAIASLFSPRQSK